MTVLGLATLPLALGFLCIPVLPAPPSGGGGTPASTFNPTVGVTLAATTVDTPSDITASLDIPGGDVLPAGVFLDVPTGWGVAADSGVIDGSLVGKILGSFTTDRVDDPLCRTGVSLDIDLIEATTATSPTVSGGDEDGNGHPDVVDDSDGNGLPDGVDRYPDFLASLAPGTHKARYFGFDVAGGLSDLFVNVLVDTAADGSRRLTVIVGDPTSVPSFGATRMCSPWSFTLTLYGTSADNPDTPATEGGEPVYTNPSSSGEYTFTAILVSEWDADDDGASNGQDNCPLVANPSQEADADKDGIGDDCDPTPLVDTNDGDHDEDTIPNGYDNCPTADNATQLDSDVDDLGDACDPDPAAPDGTFHMLYCEDPVGVGVSDPGPSSCSSTPPTPTPTAAPVGGIAELPVLVETTAAESPASAEGSAWSSGDYAALAAGVAAAAVAIAAGARYARRRWPR